MIGAQRNIIWLVLLFISVGIMGCRSEVDLVVEKQFRSGIATDILYSSLRFGTPKDTTENAKDTFIFEDLGLYCIPHYTDDSLIGGLFFGLDSLYESPNHLKNILFTPGGGNVHIPSRIFEEEFIQIDGNRMVRIHFNKEQSRWQAKVEDIWTNYNNFSRFQL